MYHIKVNIQYCGRYVELQTRLNTSSEHKHYFLILSVTKDIPQALLNIVYCPIRRTLDSRP
jgi:hypothetical protein